MTRGSIIASSIIELVIAGMVILIGAFLLSNLFGGLTEGEDLNINTAQDIAYYADELPKGKCAQLDNFFIDEGYRIENNENKIILSKFDEENSITEIESRKKVVILDQDTYNTVGNDFPINIDYSQKIEERTCLCNNKGIMYLSKMPYQYGIASGCAFGGQGLTDYLSESAKEDAEYIVDHYTN